MYSRKSPTAIEATVGEPVERGRDPRQRRRLERERRPERRFGSDGAARPARPLPRRRAPRRRRRPTAASAPRAARAGGIRAAHAPTPPASAIASAPKPAASSEPNVASSTCQTIGLGRLQLHRERRPHDGDACDRRRETDREHERHRAIVAFVAQPAPHARHQRREAGEREQEAAGDLADRVPAGALALGAQPRLGHVHVASGRRRPRRRRAITLMRASPPLPTSTRGIGEHERPIGARRPILLVGRHLRQRARDRGRSASRSALPRARAPPPSTGARRAAPRAADAEPGAPCRRARSSPATPRRARRRRLRTSRSALPTAAARASLPTSARYASGPASRQTNLMLRPLRASSLASAHRREAPPFGPERRRRAPRARRRPRASRRRAIERRAAGRRPRNGVNSDPRGEARDAEHGQRALDDDLDARGHDRARATGRARPRRGAGTHARVAQRLRQLAPRAGAQRAATARRRAARAPAAKTSARCDPRTGRVDQEQRDREQRRDRTARAAGSSAAGRSAGRSPPRASTARRARPAANTRESPGSSRARAPKTSACSTNAMAIPSAAPAETRADERAERQRNGAEQALLHESRLQRNRDRHQRRNRGGRGCWDRSALRTAATSRASGWSRSRRRRRARARAARTDSRRAVRPSTAGVARGFARPHAPQLRMPRERAAREALRRHEHERVREAAADARPPAAAPTCRDQNVVADCAVSKSNHAAGAPDEARRRHQRADDEARGERGPRGEPMRCARATARRGCSRRARRAAPPTTPATPAIVSFALRSSRKRRSNDSGTCTYGAISVSSSPATVSRSRMRASPSASARSIDERVVDAAGRPRLLRLLEQRVRREIDSPVGRARALRRARAPRRRRAPCVAASRT